MKVAVLVYTVRDDADAVDAVVSYVQSVTSASAEYAVGGRANECDVQLHRNWKKSDMINRWKEGDEGLRSTLLQDSSVFAMQRIAGRVIN